ncbi:hypothetical protein KQI61_04250 [Anaerocolumna aminovalerica]|uniref:hypothetical protein n=1 Tax=Anaerocolumna aminovalerica TaxID=1527 RepID=UPI001C0ECA85|nr:hypothetical protein [Anaerocolumna aminovalerica]MBU5331399.1 hypothetical protein [Anaerocolumna aminovalerica]
MQKTSMESNTNKYDITKSIIDGIFNLKATQFVGFTILIIAITNLIIIAKTPGDKLTTEYMANMEKIIEIFVENDNILIVILSMVIILLISFIFGLIGYNSMLRKQISQTREFAFTENEIKKIKV